MAKAQTEWDAEQVRSYLLYLLEERKLSWSAIHGEPSALTALSLLTLRTAAIAFRGNAQANRTPPLLVTTYCRPSSS
jgi:hypothetical protein